MRIHGLSLEEVMGFAVLLVMVTAGPWAWACDPYCNPCYEYQWNGSTWTCVWIGCNGGQGCPGCQTCYSTYCVCVDDNSNCPDCYSCNDGTCESHWSSGPGISDAKIYKSHNQTWFHISQSCGLVAKAHDYDDCYGTTRPDDFFDPDETFWIGENICPVDTPATTWDPVEPSNSSEGDWISAIVDDDPLNPDGGHTDDDSVTTAPVQLIAYECVGDLIFSSWQGAEYSGTVTVCECGCCGGTPGSCAVSLAHAVVTADPVLAGYSPIVDEAFFGVGPFAHARWVLRTKPGGADFSPGILACNIDVSTSGCLLCSVNDVDYDLSGLPVDISVTIGIEPVSVSITPNLTVGQGGDNCEGQAALAFGFSSQILGTRAGEFAPRLARSSGDGCGTYSQEFTYDFPGEQLFCAPVSGMFTEARAEIGGKVKAIGYIYEQCVPEVPDCWDTPYDAQASMWTEGSVSYFIDVLEVRNPPLAGPEPGYSD